jgi:hypothetical protein
MNTKPPSSKPPALKPPAGKPMLPPKLAKPPTAPSHTAKTFSVKPWTDANEGEKVILYGLSGMGKTTLASMAPNPIFMGLDDGGRKIRNPITGEPVNSIPGVETFRDMRDAIGQADLFAEGSTLVIDTVTKAEVLGEHYTFETIKTDGGKTAVGIEDYGFGKGYRFLTETMRLLLTDLDSLVRRGVNVILLAQQGQATIANLEGTDYLEDGPKLFHSKNGTGVRSEFCEWADHVFRIGHTNVNVVKANTKATKGKVSGTTERVVYTAKELHFVAKSRPIDGYNIPAVISFETQKDNSLWQYVFEGAKEAV